MAFLGCNILKGGFSPPFIMFDFEILSISTLPNFHLFFLSYKISGLILLQISILGVGNGMAYRGTSAICKITALSGYYLVNGVDDDTLPVDGASILKVERMNAHYYVEYTLYNLVGDKHEWRRIKVDNSYSSWQQVV